MRKLLNDIKDFLRIVFSNEEYPIEIGETLGKELQAALYNAEVIANGIYGSKETNKQQPNNKLTKGKNHYQIEKIKQKINCQMEKRKKLKEHKKYKKK